jgi:hypothetical protein
LFDFSFVDESSFFWVIHWVQKLMMLTIYLSLGRPAERRRSKASVSAADVVSQFLMAEIVGTR